MKQSGGAKTIIDEDLVKKVKDFVDSKVLEKQSVSVTDIGTALRISPSQFHHKEARVTFCNWTLEQPEDFEMNCIWSDEHRFQLKQGPNKQNERYWATDSGMWQWLN